MEDELPLLIVGTHDGRQHADECLACWFYQVLHGETSIKIIRSSDQEMLKHADVLLDCGSSYDLARERFDHHGGSELPKHPLGRRSGYATAGLVWKSYGPLICQILLDELREGPWKLFKKRFPPQQVSTYYAIFAHLLDQEIVAPIDAWDLGIYPDKGLTKQLLPFQWVLPHMEFEAAVGVLGRAFTYRLRALAETAACELNLENDMIENGPCEFFVFGKWLVIKAEEGKRVEIRAAHRFSSNILEMPLLAVISSLRNGKRWGAFLAESLPERIKIPDEFEYPAARKSLFHDSPERLLDYLKQLVRQNVLRA